MKILFVSKLDGVKHIAMSVYMQTRFLPGVRHAFLKRGGLSPNIFCEPKVTNKYESQRFIFI